MGQSIEKTQFTKQEYGEFDLRLRQNLKALQQLLDQPGFGIGPGSFGAELEMYIIDENGNALSRNQEIQQALHNPQLTLELNRFNLEYNLSPFAIDGNPFSSSEKELLAAMHQVSDIASENGGRVVPIGILPTLKVDDFNDQTMTDVPRYHALANRLKKDRGGPFVVSMKGQDELFLENDDITLEGANTSFQVHYRIDPANYADSFNAFQLITPLVLATASNSPTVFGHRLWHESRIPLFKKSIDTRKGQLLMNAPWHQLPRVNFGNGWVRTGIHELFAETVHLYPSLLPIVSTEDSLQCVAEGKIPGLHELRLQQSTVWLWNRPVYDNEFGGHLRIELRALPSGPTVVDMMANAALAIGLAEGLRPQINALISALPFSYATYNFYRAAEFGIHSKILWPDLDNSGLHELPVLELLKELLPVARNGLLSIGVNEKEIDRYLGVISKRLEARTSGAIWQLNCFNELNRTKDNNLACHEMLEKYYALSVANIPLSDWNDA